MNDGQLWEDNGKDHDRIEKRIDNMQNRIWWFFATVLPIMTLGLVTAIAVWADTQKLKTANEIHVTQPELNGFKRERERVDFQQTRALNWQTQAIEAIANKVGAADQLPSRPPMIDD